MDIVLHVVHILAALALIGLIMIQQGRGADAGASFGGGASQSVFGGTGSGNFLSRATAILATIFMLTSLGLAWQARQIVQGPSTPEFLQQLEAQSDVPVIEIEEDAAEIPVLEDEKAASDVPELD
ncbi:MAG TPA: preprotein translocase subunit SecG [Alcanivoracaceae bacterium]|nr:preprotein translocase subunit SecG [Alcanivoracaceae bacterium]